MSKTEFKLDKREEVKLNRAMKDAIAIERKSAQGAVVRFMIFALQSARKTAKMGKKTRDVVKNPQWISKKRTPRTAPYVILRRNQDKTDLIPKWEKSKKNDPRVKIAQRGMASNAFGVGLRKLGKPHKKKGGKRASARKFVRITKKLMSRSPSIIFSSVLGYVKKAYPGIELEAKRKAINRVLKVQERRLQKQLERRFKR